MNLTNSLQSLPNQVPEAAREATLHLFMGIGCVLLFASIVGWLLRWKLGRDNGVVANLVARTNAWWIMVAVIGVALLGGHTGVVLLFGGNALSHVVDVGQVAGQLVGRLGSR